MIAHETSPIAGMVKSDRWLRIIPVALIMYTISYIDRTNIALALDPSISTMMHDLLMDDTMRGWAMGIFFFGYLPLQIPGGYLANHWSPKKLVAIFLIMWGLAAVGCGLVSTYTQFKVMRVLLGVAEGGVFPTTLVLLANWFPRSERARANAYWSLCQPLAIVAASPITGFLLQHMGWKPVLMIEGALPFIWLPIWLSFISDHPRQAKWISVEERGYLEATLSREAGEQQSTQPIPIWQAFLQPAVFVMLAIYFLQNCAAYGCMTFLTEGLKSEGRSPTGLEFGILFAIPYVVTAFCMVINSWHSDKTRERRKHVAAPYFISGVCLIASVLIKPHSFWISYIFLCLAVPGPFTSLAPFWAIASETLPSSVMGSVMGLVNALGNLGGVFGPAIVGWIKQETHSVAIPFSLIGIGLMLAAALSLLLPARRVAI